MSPFRLAPRLGTVVTHRAKTRDRSPCSHTAATHCTPERQPRALKIEALDAGRFGALQAEDLLRHDGQHLGEGEHRGAACCDLVQRWGVVELQGACAVARGRSSEQKVSKPAPAPD